MATTQIKNGFQGGSDDQLLVNSDGSINVNSTGGGGGSNASVGPINVTAPGSATEIAGVNPEGNLTPVSVTDNGFVNVNTSGTSTVSGTVTTEQAGLNSYKTTQYTVGVTEVQLAPTPLTNRSSVSFKVHTASGTDFILFAQAPGQAATNGYRLDDGESMQMDLTASGSIYVIGSSAGQTIFLLEIA